ncbi:uncharacterized protein LOC116411581 [Xenopus tropicalis]|uniref:Uncharacterized protein LOC116411581 n=1 Tax=Xenopus tropicalis TaxID=8364 RepID=A0A8J1JPY2_XENTR|nr:uncharacterized protein LOC116411581 [Xenopus tropicalis]
MNRLIFVFLWGSRMEKLRREIVYKQQKNGGLDLPNICVFVQLQYWGCIVRILSKDSCCACMIQYMGGWLFRWWGWQAIELNRPVHFEVPKFYLCLKEFRDTYELEKLGVEEKNKKVVKQWIRRNERVSNMDGLKSDDSLRLWKKLQKSELAKRQRDVVWMSLHKCLPTREFLGKRGLCRAAVCPVGGYGDVETVDHLFWGCVYAREVRDGLKPLFRELCGLETVTWGTIMFGLGVANKVKSRVLWLLLGCIKEVLWDVRNLLIFKNQVIGKEMCLNMILGRLYVYYLRDVYHSNATDAEGVWKYKKWRFLIK